MLLADARQLPIPDNSVDLLVGFDVLYCYPITMSCFERHTVFLCLEERCYSPTRSFTARLGATITTDGLSREWSRTWRMQVFT